MPPEAMEARTILSLTPLRDGNPVGLFPAEIIGAGGHVYFVTRAADGGSIFDAEAATGAAILGEFPATTGSACDSGGVTDRTAVGSRLSLGAEAGRGQQLWMTDGTARGTTLLKDFATTGSTEPGAGAELWVIDGMVAGTTQVQDIDPGPGSSDPMPLTELGGMLIVAADDGTHGMALLSDPIPPGRPPTVEPR
jgi:ELWxxDGT repeat protein